MPGVERRRAENVPDICSAFPPSLEAKAENSGTENLHPCVFCIHHIHVIYPVPWMAKATHSAPKPHSKHVTAPTQLLTPSKPISQPQLRQINILC